MGRVQLRDPNAAPARAVVFVEPIDGTPASKALTSVVIHQRLARFDPDFVVAAVGQPVLFVNQDEIFHGVFSYSKPNQFERPPFAPSETRAVSFSNPGLVRIHSPLHTDMRGMILVVPDSHYAIPDARGEFSIEGIPAGRYRLALWTESGGDVAREVVLTAGQVTRAELQLGPER